MGRMRIGSAALAVALALAACSHGEPERPVRNVPLYSPNGEPLNGGPLDDPSCADALSRWFDRLDARHQGTIDLETFLADARRQFTAMDLDKDGVITPSVLAKYRAPYALSRQAAARDKAESRNEEGRRGGRREGNGGLDVAGLSSDQPDPVMMADVGLHNRVTLAEFLDYARRNFASLDVHHDGRLTKAELLQPCKAKEQSR